MVAAIFYVHHVYHTGRLVFGTEDALLLPLEIEGWLSRAPCVVTAFTRHVYHTVRLVFGTEDALLLSLEVEGWLRRAPCVVAATGHTKDWIPPPFFTLPLDRGELLL